MQRHEMNSKVLEIVAVLRYLFTWYKLRDFKAWSLLLNAQS